MILVVQPVVLGRQFAQHVHARHARHRQVEQQNVGSQLSRLGNRFGAVGGFAHDFQLRLRLQQAAQAIAKNGVVIRDDNTHRWFLVIHKTRILSAEL